MPEAAAYAAAADVFLPILQTGDPTAVRAGVSTFLDAHRQVDAAMNLAAKRTEAIAGTLPEEPALEQPTNQAVRLAGQAARERDYVILMLHSVLELDEGVDGLAKAAELLDEAKASTMAAAEALNPLILRNKSLVVPATFYIDVEAPLEAPPGTTVPITVTLTNVGDVTAENLVLRMTRVDANGMTTYDLPLKPVAPFGNAVQTLAETMPAADGNIALSVTTVMNGQPDTSADVRVIRRAFCPH